MALSQNWLSEGTFDSEYKQYLLLAYLQEVHHNFKEKILYPHITDLYNHYISSIAFKSNLEEIRKRQSKIIGLDLVNNKIIYEEYTDELTEDINALLDFSIAKMEEEIEFGNIIHRDIKRSIAVEKIGLRALSEDYGLLILSANEELWLYEYEVEKILKDIGQDREIKTSLIKQIKSSIMDTPDRMKEIYQEEKKQWVTTYLATCKEPLNIEMTMLPIAKIMISSTML